jgi:hypothetical protein
MEIFVQILVVLVLARLFGEAAERLGQSASVAGIALALAGLYLAPLTPWLSGLAELQESAVLAHLGTLGIFFLVLMAGIEMQPKEIAETSKAAFLVALGGMLVPLAAGCGLGWLILPEGPLKVPQALVIGVAMSITAIPATVKVLNEFDLLHSKLGETVVAAAVFDDVFGLFLLAVVTAVVQTGSLPDLGSALWLLGKIALFFAITIALGVHIYPRVSRGLKQMQADALELSALVIAALAYGLLAELLGMHWILGAFVAGLYFESARVGEAAYRDIRVTVAARLHRPHGGARGDRRGAPGARRADRAGVCRQGARRRPRGSARRPARAGGPGGRRRHDLARRRRAGGLERRLRSRSLRRGRRRCGGRALSLLGPRDHGARQHLPHAAGPARSPAPPRPRCAQPRRRRELSMRRK